MIPVVDFCERVLRTFWRHHPVNASFLGVHEYDGLLPSYDPGALADRLSDLRGHLREAEALQASAAALSADERLDLALLEGELKTAIRFEEELRIPFRSPGSYIEDATYGIYVLTMREFAPAVWITALPPSGSRAMHSACSRIMATSSACGARNRWTSAPASASRSSRAAGT